MQLAHIIEFTWSVLIRTIANGMAFPMQ